MNKQSIQQKKSRTRTWIFLAIGIVVVGTIGVLFIRNRNHNTTATLYQTIQAEKGTLTATIGATGTVRSNQSAILAWQTTGTIASVKVNPGDQINAGDVLASLTLPPVTESTLETNLVTAQENLAELISPEAVANARLAVTTAETDVINAQTALNNEQYWKNDALIQNYYANYVIAKDALDKAQSSYDSLNVGDYI